LQRNNRHAWRLYCVLLPASFPAPRLTCTALAHGAMHQFAGLPTLC